MRRLEPRRVYGITLTDELLKMKSEPPYWDRDSEDDEEDGQTKEKGDFDAVYWDTAAMFGSLPKEPARRIHAGLNV